MNDYERFLKRILSTGKVNPQSAFDLGRDAQFQALSEILIKKRLITRMELDHEMEQKFSKLVEVVEKMPQIPR